MPTIKLEIPIRHHLEKLDPTKIHYLARFFEEPQCIIDADTRQPVVAYDAMCVLSVDTPSSCRVSGVMSSRPFAFQVLRTDIASELSIHDFRGERWSYDPKLDYLKKREIILSPSLISCYRARC